MLGPDQRQAKGDVVMSYKPQAYTSAAPYLMIRDARAMLDFLHEVFGAEALRVMPRAEGQGIMHAEARIDDTVIMMGEVPEPESAHIHVYVPDPKACFARALAAGASEVQPLTDSGDGDLRGGLTDPQGITWWIATQL